MGGRTYVAVLLAAWWMGIGGVEIDPHPTYLPQPTKPSHAHACFRRGARLDHPASVQNPWEEEPLHDDAKARLSRKKMPKNFDWRATTVGKKHSHHTQNFVLQDVNQHIPQYCGSCWAHGSAAMIGDRIKVARRAKWPDISVARQVIIDCVDQGCGGGDPWDLLTWMANDQATLPDETCSPYLAQGEGRQCSAQNVCSNCLPESMAKKLNHTFPSHMDSQGCYEIPKFAGMGVHRFGNISGEAAMMKEIYARGPIVCSMAATDEFLLRYSENAAENGGVYTWPHFVAEDEVDHNVEVVGWGETKGVNETIPYWIVRNSWGTYWGAAGWFYIRRGKWNLRIEEDCQWAEMETLQFDSVYDGHVSGSYTEGLLNIPTPLPIRPKKDIPKEGQAWSMEDVPGLFHELEDEAEIALF